jgi:hypothetical protein
MNTISYLMKVQMVEGLRHNPIRFLYSGIKFHIVLIGGERKCTRHWNSFL